MRRILSDTLERVTGEPLQAQKCRDWFADWLASKKGSTAEKTLMKYQQVSKSFLAHIGGKAGLKLEAVSQADVVSFRDKLRAEGPERVHGQPAHPQNPFHRIRSPVRAGVITLNPCSTVPKLQG